MSTELSMRNLFNGRRRSLRNGFTVLLFCTAFAVAGMVGAFGGAPIPEPEDIGGQWEATALANTTPNTCHERGLRCAEWCTIYQGGTTGGGGFLCCVPPESLGGGTQEDCQTLRPR